MNDFNQRHVAVTGGTGALGSAVVHALIERGAICHVTCYAAREYESFEFKDHPSVHVTTEMDLTQEDKVEAFFGALPELWASAHIAGGFAMAPLEDTAFKDFQRLMHMNASSCFLSCREAVKAMRRVGHGGRIVNVSARPALIPTAGMVAYAASKAAVAAITQGLGEELAKEAIFVNAIVPSIMDTPANRHAMPDAPHETWPTVMEVAETIVSLLAPANQTIRGALVPVYGRT